MSNIPIDIERLCLQAAISEFVFHQPTLSVKQIPAISRVCRRFKEWCYPILYRSITFASNDASTGLPLLRRTLIESPKLALLVENLTLAWPDHSELSNIVDILPLCLNLTSFLLWCKQHEAPRLDLSVHKALRRLSCYPSVYPSSDPPHQVYLQSTHLDLNSILYPDAWLNSLTNLTHMFTSLWEWLREDLTFVDAFPPNLRVCVMWEASLGQPLREDAIALASGEVDQRMVLATDGLIDLIVPYIIRDHDDIYREWGSGSGQTFWDEAELIIKNRIGRNSIVVN